MHELTFQTKVTKQGKITIPEPTRILMGINPGDILQVTIKRERIVHSYP